MSRHARWAVMMAAALVPTGELAAANDHTTAPSMAAVRVVSDAGEMHGTAILIGREDAQHGATLYFLTSARLFRGPDGNYERISQSVTLRLDRTRELNVSCNDVFSVGSGLADVAILRATTNDALGLRPTPLLYSAPPMGAAFVLASIDEAGKVTTVSERLRFESSLLVVGDRDASALADCLGAPAVTPDGVFGIVRECDPHRSPVISLLALARPFLTRHLPPASGSVTTPRIERR